MKVIVVSEGQTLREDLEKEYRPFCEPSDIHRVGVDGAYKLVSESLIEKQRHVDFIVCRIPKSVEEIDLYNGFASWVIGLDKEYSNGNFNLNSIPLILDSKHHFVEGAFRYSFRNSAFFTKVLYRGYETSFEQGIGNAIHDWLRLLEDDMDKLDLDLRFNFKGSKVLKGDFFDTKILSRTFTERKRPLSYLWIGDIYKGLISNVSDLEGLLNRSSNDSKLRNEKEYHGFLLKNTSFLLGEDFRSAHYEKHFYLPHSRRYVEPDFVNQRLNRSISKNEVFEVKLPNRPFNYHRKHKLTRYPTKSIKQVGKYMGYFSDPGHQSEIIKRTGITESNNNFQYTLLMGREKDLEENEFILKQEAGKYPFPLKILDYDELIRRAERLYERVEKYHTH